ncbi:hypothetical protein HAX54_036433 [Datura stramonium]|uniref:Uncharacterized protein n=1 Tax=Datura stramonium TaxID=4076 RepID=A0ABS8SG57_DATST|nr:hypothetical protein [Datura stramonium]
MDPVDSNIHNRDRELSEMQTPRQASWLVRKIFDARKWLSTTNVITVLQSCCYKGKFSIQKAYIALIPHVPKWMGERRKIEVWENEIKWLAPRSEQQA